MTYLTLVFFLLMVTNCWPDVGSLAVGLKAGTGGARTGTPVFEIQVLSTLVQKYRRAQKKKGSSKLRWERFMRFMERYADVSGLAFERAPPAPDGSRNFRLAQEFGIVE